MPEPGSVEWYAEHGHPNPAAAAAEDAAMPGRRSRTSQPQLPQGVSAPFPQPVPQPSSITLTDAQRAEAEQIGRDRAEGKISDYEWRRTYERRYMELRNPTAAAELAAYKNGTAVDRAVANSQMADGRAEMEAAQSREEAMAPPRNATEYQLGFDASDEVTANLDRGIRAAAFATQMPQFVAAAMGDAIGRAAQEFESLPVGEREEQIAVRRAATQERLEQMWGAEYPARVEHLHQYLREFAQANPEADALVRYYSELIDTDTLAMDTLSRFVEHRFARRARP